MSLHDRLRPTTTRCFSVASSPNNRSILEVSARVGGAYTHALERLTEGDAMIVRGPFGNFILKERLYPHLVFLAGGIGITPFMSMIRYASELRLPNTMHLVYSCRTQTDIPYFEELTRLEHLNPNFRVTYVIGDSQVNTLGTHEVVTEKITPEVLASLGIGKREETFMLCGPGGYLTAMENLLKSGGVPSERIITESFNQVTGDGDSLESRWPRNAYALAGLSLVVVGLFVVSADMLKTIPTLEASYLPTAPEEEPLTITGSDESVVTNIQAIPPLVSTTLTQEPIIKHVSSTEVQIVKRVTPTKTPAVTTPTAPAPVVVTPVPAVVAPEPKPAVVTPVVKPKPTPTVTTKPKSKPKTRVS